MAVSLFRLSLSRFLSRSRFNFFATLKTPPVPAPHAAQEGFFAISFQGTCVAKVVATLRDDWIFVGLFADYAGK
jgi:hypothetical protein